MRVLLVEDDRTYRDLVARALRQGGFAVDEVAGLDQAKRAASVHRYDCLVLDRMLPDGDALELVSELRRGGNAVPTVFMTALDGVRDRVSGFAAGGDDYVVKPVPLVELTARVRALCRRGSHARPSVARFGDLEVDRAARKVRRGGVLLFLTPKEYALLEILIDADGAVVSRGELIERCWDAHANMLSNSVNVLMSSLRRKLGDPPVIRTVRSEGYALDRRQSA